MPWRKSSIVGSSDAGTKAQSHAEKAHHTTMANGVNRRVSRPLVRAQSRRYAASSSGSEKAAVQRDMAGSPVFGVADML